MADKSAKPRRLRAPSETVREKAVRAQETAVIAARPSKSRGALAASGKPLAWLSHKPPLKQIGHGLRWFFSLRIMRFLGKVLGITYIRDSWRELRQVAWPSRSQSRRLTTAVVVFSVIFGGLIALVDLGLNKVFKELLLR